MTDDELRGLFGYKDPTPAQAKVCVAFRTTFYNVARLVLANTSPGRAQSRAISALQDACWAAVAAVVDGNPTAKE